VLIGVGVLKEKISARGLAMLLVTFTAVMIVIIGSTKYTGAKEDAVWWHFLILGLNPIVKAMGIVMMRKVRDLRASVLACWTNFFQIVFYVPLVYIVDDGMSICRTFLTADWCILAGLGLCTVCAQTFRFAAIKRCEATKMQPYTFMRPLQQFATDFLLFGT
jgi:drug/metabolite transporter (DMT)-like permease